ncbi:MAG: endo-1,4-beta-xylanase [Defluviitaleaceae bacterium]|nr:endo-1,4-beta-xylanase [Defluviitaleaceae bacterium]MCL2262987.1 endo-1,4-beta-xylanase [Defluviitaleaceae bacterium]
MRNRIFVLFMIIGLLAIGTAGCGNNNAENGNENGLATYEPQETPEPPTENGGEPEENGTAEPQGFVIPEYVSAAGSVSLRVETMGDNQWDGVRVPSAALGLEHGNVYEFSFELFTPIAQNDVAVSMLLQTGGPMWQHIVPSEVFELESAMEWHTLYGELDLTMSAPPENIEIVKNVGGPNPTVNTLFYIDNFTVSRDGEVIAKFNFEDGNAAPFFESGHALILTGTADPLAPRPAPPTWDLTLPSLAARYADYFIIGNIIEPPLIRDNPRGVIEMFLHQYAAVTAENAMKVDAVSGGPNQRSRPDSLNLDGARTIVEFAEEHGLYMVGHTLVWHSQSAPWLYRDSQTGQYLTRAEAKENMRWFIEQYAGYFGDRIDAWDVTNEVFTDGGGANIVTNRPEGSPIYDVGTWQRSLRNNVPWYHAFANGADFDAGERAYDYIYYAFVFARRYAPSALLIYNDFNEEAPHKRNAMANMTEELNERWHNDAVNNPAYGNPSHPDYGRLLIEVIGMQAHYNSGTNMQHIRDAIERFSQTGARIHVTELDIHFRGVLNAPFTMNELQAYRQAEMFAQLFTWYKEFAEYIDRVTIWGREDATSWRGADAATHFDRFYNPKAAFWAIYDPVNWRDRI